MNVARGAEGGRQGGAEEVGGLGHTGDPRAVWVHSSSPLAVSRLADPYSTLTAPAAVVLAQCAYGQVGGAVAVEVVPAIGLRGHQDGAAMPTG